MTRLLFLLGLSCCFWGQVQAQNRYMTKTGFISFFSKAPLEDIEAQNKRVVSILEISSGQLVFSVPMTGFVFKNSLMQEHFNENYVESDKYPTATFKGKILHLKNIDLSNDNLYKVQVEGTLTIHGVEQPLKTEGTLAVKGNQLVGKATFSVSPQDFNIEIPFLVRDHIAKKIDITVNMVYLPQN